MAVTMIYSDNTKLATELVTAARLFGPDVFGVSINDDEQTQALAATGIDVLKINRNDLYQADTGAVASALKQAADKVNAEIILLSSDRSGKELTGRLAQIMEAGCLTGVNAMTLNNGAVECTRNTLGGATVAVQLISTVQKVIALSPKSFGIAQTRHGGSVTDLTVDIEPTVKILETKAKNLESVDISQAEVLVAVGQGLNRQSDLVVVESIAKALNAEVACSKPVATDKKWMSEERVIGISGKICKPELAVLMGISGQVQFTVGIRDAKTIIVVNNEEKAAICDMADYVLVADLEDVLPELENAIVK